MAMVSYRASRRPRAAELLLVAFAASMTAPTAMGFSVPAHVLFERQTNTCGEPTFSQCGLSLPAGFCCPPNTLCVPLAANTTVICCPGTNPSVCDTIQPITCDISQQNAIANAKAAIKTTALSGTLPKCGAGCCPFGYTCSATGSCVKNADQSVPPPGVSTTTSASAVPSSTAAAQPSGTSGAAASASTSGAPSSGGDSFPTVAVVVGILGGLLGGAALTTAILVYIGWRRRKAQAAAGGGVAGARPNSNGSDSKRRKSGSSFGVGYISDPIVRDDQTLRTDFIRKNNPPPRTPSRSRSRARLTSIFRRDSTASRGNDRNSGGWYPMASRSPPPPLPTNNPLRDSASVQIAPIRALRPAPAFKPSQGLPSNPRAAHPGRLQREPSSESINVFADPDTVGDSPAAGGDRDRRPTIGRRLSHMTTFTDMMETAELGGLHRGEERFVPGSANATPRR